MFYSLTGTVVFADESSVALDCGGVAFRLFTTGNTLRQCAPVGEVQTLYTHLNVREDALDLFGFAEKSELDCFKMLTGVTGVGPKAGLAILSCLTPDMLAVSVAGGDVKAITAAQGVQLADSYACLGAGVAEHDEGVDRILSRVADRRLLCRRYIAEALGA